MRAKQALLALAIFLSWVGSVYATQHTIKLTEEGCQQVAMGVVSIAHNMQVDRSQYPDDVNTVIKYILENNVGLETLEPNMLFSYLLQSCYAAEGNTDIPTKTKT